MIHYDLKARIIEIDEAQKIKKEKELDRLRNKLSPLPREKTNIGRDYSYRHPLKNLCGPWLHPCPCCDEITALPGWCVNCLEIFEGPNNVPELPAAIN